MQCSLAVKEMEESHIFDCFDTAAKASLVAARVSRISRRSFTHFSFVVGVNNITPPPYIKCIV